MMWKTLQSFSVGLLLLAAIPIQAYALDCSAKPPCPPGTTAQESVSCDACCAGEAYIKSPTDKWCCIAGYFLTPDQMRCLPDGAILKSDGSCWTMDVANPCCQVGWHTVNVYECCPDGKTLATDNEWCCTERTDGKCCEDGFIFNVEAGACNPPRPTGVVVR